MGLESASFIPQLVASNPVGATDPKSQGDDHLRLLKQVLQNQFPNIGTTAVTATATQLNAAATLSGVVTGFAAPSKKIGTAVNADGVATTAMRSDATIQLDVTLPYDWTGAHTFSQAVIATGAAGMVGLRATGAALNQKNVLLRNPNGAFAISSATDAAPTTPQQNVFVAALSGITWTSLTFGNATDNPTYNFLGTGTVTMTGAVVSKQILTSGAEDAAYFRGSAPYISFTNAAGAVRYAYIQGTTNSLLIRSDQSGGTIDLQTNGGGPINANGLEVGYRQLLTAAVFSSAGNFQQSHSGLIVTLTGATFLSTAPALANGTIITVKNNDTAAKTITSSSGNLYWMNGSGALSTGIRTIAVGGICTLWRDPTDWYIWGVGIS